MGFYTNQEKTFSEMSIDEIVDDMKHNQFLKNIDTNSLKSYAQDVSSKYTGKKPYEMPKEIFTPILSQIKESTSLKNLTDSSLTVLMGRYLIKDDYFAPTELPEIMFARVAKHIASADKIYDNVLDDSFLKNTEQEFYNMMINCEFMPNSPTLMNAGRDLGQLSGCFVLPVGDSMEEIFETYKNAALIHKSGGGTGFSFSRLRPKNDYVRQTGGISSGPVSFMKVFNTVTEVVKQGGTRRGANMAILMYNHPDIMEFIHAKDTEGQIENFNLSVGITEEFVEKALKGQDYDLINPRHGKSVGKLNAKQVLDEIIESAWKKGDPGIIFIDRINRDNPTPEIGYIESTNPCGEQPLLPYESCNLGSINLGKFVVNKNGQKEIDYNGLKQTVKKAVHFLDNVVDVNKYPFESIKKMTQNNRKIGLGVMGFADMLLKLGINYNSLNALRKAEEVMSFVQSSAKETSAEIAEKRGNFSNYEKSIHAGKGPMRNAAVTTIAPTGTIGVIAGASSGIEPFFDLAYYRKTPQFELLETSGAFLELAKEKGFYSDDLIKITETEDRDGKKKKKAEVDMAKVPDEVKETISTAHEISARQHLMIQSAFQKYTDNAVSKTINLHSESTVDDVRECYMDAYNLGNIKGVTIYRDRSRSVQVLSTGTGDNLESRLSYPNIINGKIKHGIVRVNVERPKALNVRHAKKYDARTSQGNLHITISDELFEDKDGRKYWMPYEMFSEIAPIGSELSANTAMGGLKDSYIFQGENPKYVPLIKNLKSVKTGEKIGMGEGAVFSLAHVEGLALEYHLLTNGVIGYDVFEDGGNKMSQMNQKVFKKDLKQLEFDPMNIASKVYEFQGDVKMKATANIEIGEEICPECKGTHVTHSEGCYGVTCLDCGYNKCG